MFALKYHVIKQLPKLAWIAVIEDNNIEVHCGSGVEAQDNFCVAGVWDGEFSKGDFLNARFFCGSGFRLEEGKIVFSTASHALEKLFMHNKSKSIAISNSLTLLMAMRNIELDKNNFQYERHLCSILDGINNYENQIPLANHEKIEQYFVSDVIVNQDLSVNVRRKRPLPEFESFDDFHSHMLSDLKKIQLNAISKERRRSSYGIVSTISSGYDSCACATVAKQLGCDKVVSLSGGKYDADTGEEVAKQLGYKTVIQRAHESYKSKTGCIDAEYVCSGELGTHLQFSVFEDLFCNNLVFMGLRGDYYWGLSSNPNNDYLMQGFFYYETNIGYIENALRNNYIVIPLPTYGTSVSTSIRRISLSGEMKPWTLGNDYDRPIPRRIVEQSGVSRESFGQKKSGGGFSFGYDTRRTLQRKMTKEGYSLFTKYKHHSSFKRLVSSIKYNFLLMPTYFNVINRKLHIHKKYHQPVIRMGNPGAPSDLIHWGANIMVSRYRKALRGK